MIKTKEELYDFIENCIKGQYMFNNYTSVDKLKINVLKFQNNFSNLVTYTTEILNIAFVSRNKEKTKACFCIRTNHPIREYIYHVWFDEENKIFLKSDYTFQTYVYFDEEKNNILVIVNQIRLRIIEEHIKNLQKVQNNFNRLITNTNLKFIL